jgi:hypothetical protein
MGSPHRAQGFWLGSVGSGGGVGRGAMRFNASSWDGIGIRFSFPLIGFVMNGLDDLCICMVDSLGNEDSSFIYTSFSFAPLTLPHETFNQNTFPD